MIFELAFSELNSPCGKDLKRSILTGKYLPNTTQILKQASFSVGENMTKA